MAKLTKDAALAQANQGVLVSPTIKYPGINPEEPYRDYQTFYRDIVGHALGIPVLDEDDYAPPVKFFDDFFEYNTTFTWAVTEDAGATAPDAITDAAGGVLSIGCDGDDNDECYVSSVAENWLVVAAKPLYFEASINLTEANTDDANWIIGLSDTVGANSLVDDGAGPMASYDGIVFFKVDGGTDIQFEVSNAATQTTNTAVSAFATATDYRLGFLVEPGLDLSGDESTTKARITPYVNGTAGTAQDVLLSGLAEMHILMGVKAGGTNEEALLVDYVQVVQAR